MDCLAYLFAGMFFTLGQIQVILSGIPVEQIRDFEDGLHEALTNEGADILDAIRSTKKLDESTEVRLKDFLTDAVASYLDRH